MPNNHVPDPRFAMIALELTADDSPAPAARPAETTLLVSGGSIVCPRCGNDAFARGLGREVVCLGCLDNPRYPLPDGVELNTYLYRCGGCGLQVSVTMMLADVNLHCAGCQRLTLHTRRGGAPGIRWTLGATRGPGRDYVWNEPTRRQRRGLASEGRPSVIVDSLSSIVLSDDHPALVELTQTMTFSLGLEDFDAYAARRRYENSNACATCDMSRAEHQVTLGRSCENFTAVDVSRGTGRTLRGIVELLARHRLDGAESKVWVLGATERTDDWLRMEVTRVRRQLGKERPNKVETVPDLKELVARQLKPPAGVMLFVDHTYYELVSEVTYRPDFMYRPDF